MTTTSPRRPGGAEPVSDSYKLGAEAMRDAAAKVARDASEFMEAARRELSEKAKTENVAEYTEKHHALFCSSALALDIAAQIEALPLPAGDTLSTVVDAHPLDTSHVVSHETPNMSDKPLSTGGWNSDMDKAPRDGTHILCIDGDGSVFRAAWAQEHEGYWECWCGQPVVYPPEPTAWMPLPEPPPGE